MVGWGPWAWGGFAGWWMVVGMLVPWLLLAGLIWLVWSLAGRQKVHGAALEALQLRYVRGEISKEEYQAMRQELRR